MDWKLLDWIGEPIFWGFILYRLFFSPANGRTARVLNSGLIEFRPSPLFLWATTLFAVRIALISVRNFRQSHGEPFSLVVAVVFGLGAFALLGSLPGTVVVTAEGLEEVSWFWRNIRIRWDEIEEISCGVKDRTVTIKGKNGKKIVHSRFLADRPRFLLELKQHCGDELPPDFPQEPIAGQ